MRKLATIRKIDNIRPIVDADAIEAAVVGGWTVVVKKDEFKVGDLAVYLEIDSWVPHELAPFLSKGVEPTVRVSCSSVMSVKYLSRLLVTNFC